MLPNQPNHPPICAERKVSGFLSSAFGGGEGRSKRSRSAVWQHCTMAGMGGQPAWVWVKAAVGESCWDNYGNQWKLGPIHERKRSYWRYTGGRVSCTCMIAVSKKGCDVKDLADDFSMVLC